MQPEYTKSTSDRPQDNHLPKTKTLTLSHGRGFFGRAGCETATVALGMKRPTLIQDEDDFEIEPLPDNIITLVPARMCTPFCGILFESSHRKS